MNEYLTREIWKMRKNIKTRPGTPVVSLLHVENKTYQLLFMSCGCENACTFCNYGFDYNLTLEMVKPELTKIRLEEFDIAVLESTVKFILPVTNDKVIPAFELELVGVTLTCMPL